MSSLTYLKGVNDDDDNNNNYNYNINNNNDTIIINNKKKIFHAFLFNIRNYSPEVININT